MNCLNKKLITHFVCYLKKEEKYDIETLSIDRVLNQEHFYWEIMQKMCTRGYPFLTLENKPKNPLHARNSFKNKIF